MPTMKYRMEVLSDAQSAYGLPELRAVGLADYFAPIIISGDYGYSQARHSPVSSRPDRIVGLSRRAIFVGNERFREVMGARQVGMKTILFCPAR